jgi:hypothetical protein
LEAGLGAALEAAGLEGFTTVGLPGFGVLDPKDPGLAPERGILLMVEVFLTADVRIAVVRRRLD